MNGFSQGGPHHFSCLVILRIGKFRCEAKYTIEAVFIEHTRLLNETRHAIGMALCKQEHSVRCSMNHLENFFAGYSPANTCIVVSPLRSCCGDRYVMVDLCQFIQQLKGYVGFLLDEYMENFNAFVERCCRLRKP
ncbi:hypothetical protein RY27_09300 [Litorilinea aerophila]|nr:hypothetical protein RY27_09300 [Litorilinea aerophila]